MKTDFYYLWIKVNFEVSSFKFVFCCVTGFQVIWQKRCIILPVAEANLASWKPVWRELLVHRAVSEVKGANKHFDALCLTWTRREIRLLTSVFSLRCMHSLFLRFFKCRWEAWCFHHSNCCVVKLRLWIHLELERNFSWSFPIQKCWQCLLSQ